MLENTQMIVEQSFGARVKEMLQEGFTSPKMIAHGEWRRQTGLVQVPNRRRGPDDPESEISVIDDRDSILTMGGWWRWNGVGIDRLAFTFLVL